MFVVLGLSYRLKEKSGHGSHTYHISRIIIAILSTEDATKPVTKGFSGTFVFLCMHQWWSICAPVAVHCAGNTNGGALVQCVVETREGTTLHVTASGCVIDTNGVVLGENADQETVLKLSEGDTFVGYTVSTVQFEKDGQPPRPRALKTSFLNNTPEPIIVSVEVPGDYRLPAPRKNQPRIVKSKEIYVMVFMESFRKATSALTDNEAALLCKLLPYYDYEGKPLVYETAGMTRQVNIATAAKIAGWGRNRVSRTVQSLVEKGIFKMVKAGTSSVLCLNPRYVWSGHLSKRPAVIKRFEGLDSDG